MRLLNYYIKAIDHKFTNSSRVLPKSNVVYQPITHRNLWSITTDVSALLPSSGCLTWQLKHPEEGNREIKHRVFLSRERQRWSRDLTFPAFAVCRPPFLLEEDIFPVCRERENVSICSPCLPTISTF